MKRITAIACTIVCSLLSLGLFAQTNWVKQKLDEKIGVKFPKSPENIPGGIVYKCVTDDSSYFIATATDFAPMGLDSATLASLAPTEEFAEQFKVGFLGKLPGVEISNLEIATWKEQICYNIEGENAEKKYKLFVKCIFIGSKVYVLSSTIVEKGDLKNKDTFLASIEYL